jgi:hypothetical protein
MYEILVVLVFGAICFVAGFFVAKNNEPVIKTVNNVANDVQKTVVAAESVVNDVKK